MVYDAPPVFFCSLGGKCLPVQLSTKEAYNSAMVSHREPETDSLFYQQHNF